MTPDEFKALQMVERECGKLRLDFISLRDVDWLLADFITRRLSLGVREEGRPGDFLIP
jgi:hypothetical protein